MAPESPDGQSLSGVPPIAWFSGLQFGGPGGGGFSGQSQSDSLSGTQAGVKPGIQGGLSLDQLTQLLQLQTAEAPQGAPNTSSLLAALGGPGLGTASFGQQAGGIGGQSQLAGQTTNAPTGMISGSGGGTSADPAALLAKFLGAAKTAVGVASPQAGDQNSGDQTGAASVSTASPVAQNYGSDFAASVGNQSPVDAFNQLKAAGLSDAEANDVMMLQTEAPEFRSGFGVGITPGADTTAGTFGQQGNVAGGNTAGGGGGLSGSNVGGAISGGLGAAGGLLGLLQSSNFPGGLAAGLQGVGGLAKLLNSLGISDFSQLGSGIGNTSLLGDIAGGAQGLGGLLGIGTGIEGLVSGKGNPVAEGVQVGQGAISALQAANQLAPEAVAAASEALGLGAQGIGIALEAASPWLSVAAPVIMGLVGYMENQDRIQAERFGARQFRSQAGYAQNQIGELGGRLSGLDVSQLTPDQQQAYLNAAAQDFQSIDPASQPMTGGITINTSPLQNAFAYANAGVNPSATDPTGAANQSAANQYGKGLLSAYPGLYERMAYALAQNPNLNIPTMESGGRKTGNIQSAEQAYGGTTPYEGWYSSLPGLPTPFVEGQPGGNNAQDVNPAIAGFISRDVAASPFYAQDYWQAQGVTPAEAFLYGAGNIGNGALGGLGLNLPGVTGNDFRAYDPANLYQSLVGGGMQNLGGLNSIMAPPAPIALSSLAQPTLQNLMGYDPTVQYGQQFFGTPDGGGGG